mmetsp:Transcript_15759/g.22214  ORF Transcript_15759/g.22214 Transcript_15759/m.22214 type:complete len:346 (+) Transcript_15759:127-1164(+)
MMTIAHLEAPPIVMALLLLFVVTLAYIFYPAYIVALADSLPIEEELISPKNSNGGKSSSQPLLSIVVPAYNEEERLPIMLDSALNYLESHRETVLNTCRAIALKRGESIPLTSSQIEWLVVSDGSKDGTCDIVRQYGKKRRSPNDSWKLIELKRNGGKGAAVKAGMIRTTGMLCLMVDADGATEFGKGLELVLDQLLESLEGGGTVLRTGAAVFGSRAHLVKDKSVAQRSFVRNLLMHAFQFFVKFFVTTHVRDTQCGFKLFTRDATVAVFRNLHLRRWAFDTEVVVRAEQLGIPISEVSVPWHEVDGSKLSTSKIALALVSLSMLRDMICVRACYALRIWKIKR